MKTADPVTLPPAERAAPARAIWHVVLTLALPVLAQQFLILTVNLSDRFLAGRFASPHESVEAVEPGLQATAPQVAYQAAQTTAGYLAWFISCYTVLVSVGSTALVARFTGAGDRAAAV